MRPDQLLRELKLEGDPALLEPYWEEDRATVPELPDLLRPEVFLPLREYARVDPAVDPHLETIAAAVRSSAALRLLWWHCCQLLLTHRDYPGEKMVHWPSLEPIFGPHHALFHLLSALGTIPLTQSQQRPRGLSDDATRTALADNFTECVGLYRMLHPDRWGVDLRVLYWLRYPASGVLFRLGRMEFMNRPYHGQALAYRHRKTGVTVALAAAGAHYGPEGYLAAATAPGAWQATLETLPDRVRGYFLDPRGHATREIMELPTAQWDCVLQPGDPVLEMHIPFGGGFHPELCRDAMQQAVEFFPRNFPEQSFAGLGCTSWILNPQLDRVYRPDSNMVRWQQEMYLYPVPSSGRDGLFFLFGREDVDLATAPRDTSLRRALLDWLAAGKRLLSGGAFMLTADLPRYGSQPYRHHRRPR